MKKILIILFVLAFANNKAQARDCKYDYSPREIVLGIVDALLSSHRIEEAMIFRTNNLSFTRV